MYSLDCTYYKDEFSTIEELIENIKSDGMDPNYQITLNGRPTGEMACELIYY